MSYVLYFLLNSEWLEIQVRLLTNVSEREKKGYVQHNLLSFVFVCNILNFALNPSYANVSFYTF